MRLYSLADAAGVDHDGEHYAPGNDGGFDLPDELAELLHASAVRGVRQWETAIERQKRLIDEEMQRRQSPEALYEAVSKLVQVAEAAKAPAEPSADAKEAPKPAGAKAVAKATLAKGAEN
jgi:hypothetical protein